MAGASCWLLAVPQDQAWVGRRGFPVSSSAGPSLAFKTLMAPRGPVSLVQWGVQAWTLEPDHLGLHPSVAPPSCVTLGRFLNCPCLGFLICKMDH